MILSDLDGQEIAMKQEVMQNPASSRVLSSCQSSFVKVNCHALSKHWTRKSRGIDGSPYPGNV